MRRPGRAETERPKRRMLVEADLHQSEVVRLDVA